VNFLTEINNYIWEEDKLGKKTNKPVDDQNHLMDAMRYAVEDYSRGALVSFLD
jgi:phage terminase large subunit